MKKIFFFVFVFVAADTFGQQVPVYPIDNYNNTNTQATFNASFWLYSPSAANSSTVNISQDAGVNFFAGQQVVLLPGFQAGGFTNNGFFRAQINAASDFDVAFIEPNQNYPSVGQYEKLELGMTLPAALQQQVDQFISSNFTSGINPFDPDQISVEADFVYNGTTHYSDYGFYFDDFMRDPNAMAPLAPANWLAQPTPYHWRIRFAPPWVGNWSCTISIRVNNTNTYAYQVGNIFFQCVGSSNKGFLTKGSDGWHLKYSGSQTSFFALGQNIAWTGGTYFNGGGMGDGLIDVNNYASNLADNGGNMFRIVNTYWTYELESEHVGNYYNQMNRAWELDRVFEMAEEKNLKIFFCSEFHRNYGKINDSDHDQLSGWHQNPYYTELGIATPDEFLISYNAQKKFKNKLRYFLSRWGYSTSLGVFELLSEMDGWTYAGNNDMKMNPSGQIEQFYWHTEMLAYIKSFFSFRPILTSTSYGSHAGRDIAITPFDLPLLDITTFHAYEGDRRVNLFRYKEFNDNVPLLWGTHAIWVFKPTTFDEMGLAPVPHSNADQGDIEDCDDVSYHNSLWATSMMGGIGGGLNWWSWSRDDYRHANFPALRIFFQGQDFEHEIFNQPDFWDDADFLDFNHSTSTIENFSIADYNGYHALGWVHNTSYYWGNIDQNCHDRHNNTMDPPSDDDDANSVQSLLIGTKFEIHKLNNYSHFSLYWYNTRGNGGILGNETYSSNIFGTVKGSWPGGHSTDFAYKVYRTGGIFREVDSITTDTLLCSDDTVSVYGRYYQDTLHNYTYHWDFGNGNTSDSRDTVVVYSLPGTYLVTLAVHDSLGFHDTLRQYIVKPNCANSSRLISKNKTGTMHHFSVYPNPTNGLLKFDLDSSWAQSFTIILTNLQSQILVARTSTDESKFINLEGIAPGIYFLTFRDAKHEETQRIILIQ